MSELSVAVRNRHHRDEWRGVVGHVPKTRPHTRSSRAHGCAEQWFGPGLQGRPLASVAPSLKEATVAKHLAKGREFTLTGEIAPPSGRRVAFRLSIAP